jgi:calcium/calmodulin-dependent protein kinase I
MGTDNKTGERVAIKMVNKEVVEKEDSLQSEINILAMVDHPNVVKMHAMFDTPTHLLIVMELMEGGELYDEINARSVFTEQEAATIIRQLLSALSYLHARNIVHRDLKLENLLLARKGDLTIKLADFGLSKLFNGTSMYTACGTPFYVAPDILMASDDSGYGPAVDMWAVGILLYILLSGRLPFAGETDEELFENIIQAKLVFKSPQFDVVSAQAKDFISHLLTAEPEDRMSADEALEHVFIQQVSLN